MKETLSPGVAPQRSTTSRLLQSGIIFSAISFITGLINFVFQGVINRRFAGHHGEFGLANNTVNFVGFLGMPLLIATTAVTHYIAHYKASGDHHRLRGLLLGCRKILFWFTLGGSVLAMLLVAPMGKFFNFRYSLVMVALACVLASLWGSFATALCQGLAWFKRLAIIGFASAILKCAFTWYVTYQHPVAEVAVASTIVGLLANLALLYWRKEIFQHGEAVSPWDREFVLYLVAGAACVAGNVFFLQMDPLVAQRYFSLVDIDHYSNANKLATALPNTVGPLLIVLFTSRSGNRTGDATSAQLRLMALYGTGLLIGLVGLLSMRSVCLRIITGQPSSPEAAAMMGPVSLTLVFAGLLQALGMWALASRWLKVSVLYGAMGLAYWLILLSVGTTPARLLGVMPWAAGSALVILFIFWIRTMKAHHSPEEFS